MMKDELHGLIHSLFPHADTMVIDILGVSILKSLLIL